MAEKNYDKIAKVFDFFRQGDLKRWGHIQRQHFEPMRGRVLHVGAGTGLEIQNFPAGLDITAIDLSPRMLARAHARAGSYRGTLRCVQMNAEALAFPDHSFDTVAAVCVFCTVADPVQGLKEVRRVLKPDGKLLMFEHVLSRNLFYGLSLRFMSLFTTALEGTHLDRDTVGNVRKAGFRVEADRNVYLDIVKAIVAVP